MRHHVGRYPGHTQLKSVTNDEGGFVLFTTLVIVIVVGIVAVSSLRTTELTEVLSGNSIQRGRAFDAAQGALIEAERDIANTIGLRVFASTNASDGVFTLDSLDDLWWRSEAYTGMQQVEDASYPGLVSSPVYAVEEIGYYQSDANSGIVSLDRGGAAYGSLTSTGRELVLYRVQSNGVGSTTSAQAVVESLYVKSH